MNLYGHPSAKAEIVLADAWAASARAGGHRQKFPSFPPPPQTTKKTRYCVKKSDRDAVLNAITKGRRTFAEITTYTGFGRMAASATLSDLVASGRLTVKTTKMAKFYSIKEAA